MIPRKRKKYTLNYPLSLSHFYHSNPKYHPLTPGEPSAFHLTPPYSLAARGKLLDLPQPHFAILSCAVHAPALSPLLFNPATPDFFHLLEHQYVSALDS